MPKVTNILVWLFYLQILSLSTGCQQLPEFHTVGTDEVFEILQGREFLTDTEINVSVDSLMPDDKPFAVTPQMRAFARHHVYERAPDEIKIRLLVQALLSPSGLALKYDPGKTYTAEKSFEMAEVNCLSFTMLFLVLAEEVGLKVSLNEVAVPPVWDFQSDDRLIYYKHVNAVVMTPFSGRKVVDINLENFDPHYAQRRISKNYTEALYYNNRGAEFMFRGDTKSAFLYFRKAIVLEPEMGFAWGNLGALYRQVGNSRLAEYAYVHALGVAGFDPVVAGNLARIRRAQGLHQEAIELENLLASFRDKNPYYHFALARLDFGKGDYSAAMKHIDRSIGLDGEEHRFHMFKAMLHYRQGDLIDAKKDLEMAYGVALDEAVKERYQAKIARLQGLAGVGHSL